MKKLVLSLVLLLSADFYVHGQDEVSEPSEKEALPKVINSAYMEARPLISPDGTILYFCRRNYPENFNGESDRQDIWSSKRLESGEWSQPENLGEPLNNKGVNAIVSITSSSDTGYFVNSYQKMPKNATNVLAKAYKTDGGWSEPESITIERFSNRSVYADFYYSDQANVLLLAIEKVDDKELVGDQDLYVSFPTTSGKWGEPVNLGNVVNTNRADYAPFLGADGKSLFFVSEGHTGEGGSDIFYAKRLDDSWTQWSVPENLGQPINSKAEESYFSITSDFEEIYFESYKKRALNRDIYSAKLPDQFKPSLDETLPEVAIIPTENVETEPLANSAPINSTKEDPETENEFAAEQVTNNLVEEPETEIPDDNLVEESEPLENSINTSTSLLTKAENSPSVTGTAAAAISDKILDEFERVHIENGNNLMEYIILPNIYFDFNKDEIKNEYQAKLDKVYNILSEEPSLVLEIMGFADAVGGENINEKISQQRAESVAKYLAEKGSIPIHRLVSQGLGEKYPLASNDDENEGRELNRRVELKFVLHLQ